VEQWCELCFVEDYLGGGGAEGKIFGKDEVRQSRVVFPGKIAEQAPESGDVYAARFIGQGWMLISKPVNPAEQISRQGRALKHKRKKAVTEPRSASPYLTPAISGAVLCAARHRRRLYGQRSRCCRKVRVRHPSTRFR
jgi:hypothetical protein